MFDITTHSGRGTLTRSGKTFEVDYDVEAVRTYRLRIAGTIRGEMDVFPLRDELHMADLRLETGQMIRIMFQHVDALAGEASFYVNRAGG
jgi:hypothetical protein